VSSPDADGFRQIKNGRRTTTNTKGRVFAVLVCARAEFTEGNYPDVLVFHSARQVSDLYKTEDGSLNKTDYVFHFARWHATADRGQFNPTKPWTFHNPTIKTTFIEGDETREQVVGLYSFYPNNVDTDKFGLYGAGELTLSPAPLTKHDRLMRIYEFSERDGSLAELERDMTRVLGLVRQTRRAQRTTDVASGDDDGGDDDGGDDDGSEEDVIEETD